MRLRRVWFLRRFGLKTGIDFGLESGIVFEETNSKRIRKKEREVREFEMDFKKSFLLAFQSK